MLRTLIAKEIVQHVLSLRFAVTFLLMLLLVFTSFYLTANEFHRRRDEFAAMQRDYREALDQMLTEKDDWRRIGRIFRWEGKSDAVPIAPLSSVAEGLTSAHPAGVTTTIRGWINIDSASATNPLLGLYHVPDLVYVVGVVLSLLALLFVFDAVCGEKESGMLRLVLCNSVPRHQVLLSKWIGGYLVLIAPFAIAALGGLGYTWASGAVEPTREHLIRIGALLVLALLFISVFFTLGMFISTLTHRSATSLFVCLFVWVAWVMAIPNVAPVAAKLIAPAPSARKIAAEKDAIEKEIDLRKRRLTLTSGELSYGQKIIREQEKLDREGKTRMGQWDRYLEACTQRETRWAQLFGRMSPSACWVYAATALTQTGPAAYGEFEDARKRLHDKTDAMQKEIRQQWRQKGKPPDIRAEGMPVLAVSYPDLGTSIEMALADILILFALNVLFFMASFAFFLRYDVR